MDTACCFTGTSKQKTKLLWFPAYDSSRRKWEEHFRQIYNTQLECTCSIQFKQISHMIEKKLQKALCFDMKSQNMWDKTTLKTNNKLLLKPLVCGQKTHLSVFTK